MTDERQELEARIKDLLHKNKSKIRCDECNKSKLYLNETTRSTDVKPIKNFKDQTYTFRKWLFPYGLVLAGVLSLCSAGLTIAWFICGVNGLTSQLPPHVAIAFISGLTIESIAIVHIIAKSIFPRDNVDNCVSNDIQERK